jgi:transcriptional regulator with XRE-family HTH domain
MKLRLREWRLRRGESLYTLADKAGVHFTTIVRIEQGRMSPTVAMLEKLSKALRVHITALFPPKPRSKGGRDSK